MLSSVTLRQVIWAFPPYVCLLFHQNVFLWLKVKGTLGGNRGLPNLSIAYVDTLLAIS